MLLQNGHLVTRLQRGFSFLCLLRSLLCLNASPQERHMKGREMASFLVRAELLLASMVNQNYLSKNVNRRKIKLFLSLFLTRAVSGT